MTETTWLDVLDTTLKTLGSLLSVALLFLIFKPGLVRAIGARARMRAYARRHGRSVVVLSHGKDGGGFASSMLSMPDVVKVERQLRKVKGRPVDVILTTFGGDLIAGLRLARILKRTPGVRLVVPKYAFSAGTLVALASRVTLAGPDAMFGPVDPQIGWIFDGVHAAKDWVHAAKSKGSEARDATLMRAEAGRRVLDEVRGYVRDLLPEGADAGAVLQLLVDGDVSHARVVSPQMLRAAGVPVEVVDMDEAAHIVELAPDGVRAFILPGARA